MRQHPINEVGSRIRHAPPGTRWAKTATFARERDQTVIAAVLAANAKKAIRKDAATEVGIEFAANEFWQRALRVFATRVKRG